ncbi:hypothetical protein ACE1MK_06415 [Tenacibaculum maritimum]|uniref:hypothetical protein n=2 Tax=Tenacibaculum maritimum TaxID=107401 RepID=UPI0012E41535|nr:hypothetical protein [Tenacibaculum maritimum]MCD9581462.1 hypothetical protein [Tenacibaculum maritimum]MCD9635890.1 hypothetical protein [Tenacibaculum maritimum]CAA0170612.1 hypothetical protein USCSE301_160008 [Tenacibaculum maritimum]CAA0177702.1 hypothetical protein USCSP91_190006 [Tenacibaculum maritimum]
MGVTNKEIDLMIEFILGDITEQEFLKNYPINLQEDKTYLLNLIKEKIKKKDANNLSIVLDTIALLNMYKDYDRQLFYKKIIKEEWHEMHRDLINLLDKIEENEEYFIEPLSRVYSYYKGGIENLMNPIWNTCLWSLYKIRTKRAMHVIEAHCNSKYEYIKKTSNKIMEESIEVSVG